MPYTMKNAPPKNVLPKDALRLWVNTYNAVYDETGDEDEARQAAWSNVKKDGWHKTEDGHWTKAQAVASIYIEPALLDEPVETFGFEIPDPTPSKAWAVFRLLSFYPVVNARHDTFAPEDVSEAAIKSLRGSPIFGNDHLTDHYNLNGDRGPQVGAVVDVKRRDDGVYGLCSVYKHTLETFYGLAATELPTGYSVSMEARFEPDTARYKVGSDIYSREEAVARGYAAFFAGDDDPRNYDARFLTPIEYHAVALLRRGRNADPTADVLLTAASVTEERPMLDLKADEENVGLIDWNEADFDAHVQLCISYGAELTSKTRKKLDRSDFAYVDEKGEGHLPIHDAAHAKNALARLNQTDIPESAKRSAFRKVVRAMRRFGVEPDKDSEAYKAYATLYSDEERRESRKTLLQESLSTKNLAVDASTPITVVSDAGASTIFTDGGTIYEAVFRFNEDADLEVGDILELAKLEAATTPYKEQNPMDEKQIQEAIRVAREEAETALRASLTAEFEAREPQIATAAVERFKGSEEYKTALAAAIEEAKLAAVQAFVDSEDYKTVIETARQEAIAEADRIREAIASHMKELEGISPFKDEAEKQSIETRVAETVNDELAWLKLRTERLENAYAALSKKVSTVASRPMPTLVADSSVKTRNIFDLTEEG